MTASGPVDLGFSGWTGCLLVGNPGGGTRKQLGPGAARFGKLLSFRGAGWSGSTGTAAAHPGQRGPQRPGGFVLGHGAAYITNNSILSDAGQVVKVAI